MPKTRTGKIILAVIVVFILYAIIHDPTGSAQVVKQIWHVISTAVQAIFTFFDKIIN